MIRGLTWGNARWLALFTLLFIMTVSADGAYRLNWSIVQDIWIQVQAGGKGAWKAQGEAAKKLDAETQKRYGFDPIEPRGSNCVTTPNPNSPRLSSQHLAKINISRPSDRAGLIQIIGEPYCKEASASEIWLVNSSKTLEVNYNPISYQLKEIKP